METEKKQKKSNKFYWFALGIGLAAAVCSVCLAVRSEKTLSQTDIVNVDMRNKDETQYIHNDNGSNFIFNKSSYVLAIIFPSDSFYRLDPGDSLQYSGGCTIYTYYTSVNAYIDVEADGEYLSSYIINDNDGYNTEIDYNQYVITDTPFISGTVVPSFPGDVSLGSVDLSQLFTLSNVTAATKTARKLTLSNFDFKLGYYEAFDTFDKPNQFDRIDVLYIHSYKVGAFGSFESAHDLLFYIAVNTMGKYCVPFASNATTQKFWVASSVAANGYKYYCPSGWQNYIFDYLTKTTQNEWDSAYYSANRQEVLNGCQFIHTESANFVSLIFNKPAYLTDRQKKTVFASNWTTPVINDETYWITTVTTLIGTSIVALLPLFSLTVLPGITLGFLFFLPFFITLFVIIIKALKK